MLFQFLQSHSFVAFNLLNNINDYECVLPKRYLQKIKELSKVIFLTLICFVNDQQNALQGICDQDKEIFIVKMIFFTGTPIM